MIECVISDISPFYNLTKIRMITFCKITVVFVMTSCMERSEDIVVKRISCLISCCMLDALEGEMRKPGECLFGQ